MRSDVVRALLAGLLLTATAALAQDPAPDAGLAGAWEGQVQFVDGRRARVRLDLTGADRPDTYRGRYALSELDEEGAGTPRVVQVSATLERDGRLAVTLPNGRTFRGEVADAMPHAELCFYGAFADAVGGRGVFTLWRYRAR